MLAPLNPRETPSAKPLGPGSLSLDQPFGAITLPVALTTSLRLSPDQFEQLCLANPEAVLELAQDGHVIAMTPTGGDTGARNGELFFQIKAWARAQGGWMAFDSSTGFRLPDDAVLSPDTSLVALDRWQALTPEQRRRIPPSAPTWWSSWPAPVGPARVTKAPEGSRPCARRWPPTNATAPASAGC